PIRWNANYGWRLMCEQERLGMFYFWREVGRRMNIQDLPAEYDAFEKFNLDYERSKFRYSDSNHRIGAATRDLFLSWSPRLMRFLVRPAIYAIMDDTLITAFGFPKPSWFMR